MSEECSVHAGTVLVCPRCEAQKRGRKGGCAKSAKQTASRRKVMAEVNAKKAGEGDPAISSNPPQTSEDNPQPEL